MVRFTADVVNSSLSIVLYSIHAAHPSSIALYRSPPRTGRKRGTSAGAAGAQPAAIFANVNRPRRQSRGAAGVQPIATDFIRACWTNMVMAFGSAARCRQDHGSSGMAGNNRRQPTVWRTGACRRAQLRGEVQVQLRRAGATARRTGSASRLA
jgi:hypothetical protein